MRMRLGFCLAGALSMAGMAPSSIQAGESAQAQSQVLSPADQQEVQSIIRRQLDAFRADDGTTAFGFASPDIQGMFGNADTFMKMVQQSYPQVYRPREIEFRDVVQLDGRPTQRVMLVGPDGKPVMALYAMERQPDGSWRIDGCMLGKADDMTA